MKSAPSLALWVDYPTHTISTDEYKTYLLSLSSFLKENPAITEVVLRINDPDLHGAFERSNFNETLKDFPAEVRLEALPEETEPSSLSEKPAPAINPLKYVISPAFDSAP